MLGDLLRKKREELNLTLEDVEKGTNIRKLYINALESEQYDKLPKADIFCKGFVRSYGKFLGLNGEELVDIFLKEKYNRPMDDEPSPPVEVPQEKKLVTSSKKENNVKRTKLSDFADHQQYMQQKTINKPKLIAIIASIIVIVILIIVGLGYLSNNSKDETTTKQNITETTKAEPVAKSPLTITASFNQDVWTIVSVDGKEVLGKVVPKGSSITWDATKNISILASNPEAVSISVNNGKAEPLADSKTEATVMFSLDDQGTVKSEVVSKKARVEDKKPEVQSSPTPTPVENKPVVKPKVEKPAAPAPQQVKQPKVEHKPDAQIPKKEENNSKSE